MTSGKPPKRRRGLADEDQALWDFVASSIEPERGKRRVPDVETPDVFKQMLAPADGHSSLGKRVPKPAPAQTAPARALSKALPPPEPQAVLLERRRVRRLVRGAEEIEARLDLHGMTQDDAHASLTGFIRRCHAAGLRTVLIITGKGGAAARRDADENHAYDGWHRKRGVLKRNVPIWLSQPGLAGLVVSFSTAHVRHGGEGALYVQIRVKR